MDAVRGSSKALLVTVVAINLYCLFVAYYYFISKDHAALGQPQHIQDKLITKKIGFWNGYFGDRRWNLGEGTDNKMLQCGSRKCLMVRDVKDPVSCDALVFHIRDAHKPPAERSMNQVYLALLHENPYYKGNGFIKGKDFYNWTATYKRNSDIYSPYFKMYNSSNISDVDQFVSKLPQITHNNLTTNTSRPTGQPAVLWLVSHCKTVGNREQYAKTLSKYIHIDKYGGCGRRCPTKNCLADLANTGKYKFYLSFENAACKDYITEKFSNPLKIGLVPIVYGGLTHADYTAVIPEHSFIDVRNFTSAKRLADYLLYLHSNATAYAEYFQWKSKYVVGRYNWQCDVCRALYNSSMLRPRTIDFANFLNTRDCDANLHRHKG